MPSDPATTPGDDRGRKLADVIEAHLMLITDVREPVPGSDGHLVCIVDDECTEAAFTPRAWAEQIAASLAAPGNDRGRDVAEALSRTALDLDQLADDAHADEDEETTQTLLNAASAVRAARRAVARLAAPAETEAEDEAEDEQPWSLTRALPHLTDPLAASPPEGEAGAEAGDALLAVEARELASEMHRWAPDVDALRVRDRLLTLARALRVPLEGANATEVRRMLADRGYRGADEPVAVLLGRVLDQLGARSTDPYGTGDGSYRVGPGAGSERAGSES